MKWPIRGSLVWRLCLLGFAQLVLLAASVLLVGYLLRSVLDSPRALDAELRGRAGRPGAPPLGEAGRRPRPGPPHGPPRDGPGPFAPLLTFFVSGLLIVGGGAVLTWRWMARPLSELARAAGALGTGDLKARARLTRGGEMGELGRGFDEMAERIESLVVGQKELLANVSHELRTPLARIRVALDIASEGDAEVARVSLMEIAVDLGELEGMIDDILTTTRIDLQSGAHRLAGFALRRHGVAPGSVAELASERFRARHPGRALDVKASPGLADIDVDTALFRRVIDNLLENARKYSPEDSAITLSVTPGVTGVVFEVTDQGMGISARDLPRIFEPFFRAERSRSRGGGGVGLGLTLAKRIVEAHGGRIEVESGPGPGTRARVLIG